VGLEINENWGVNCEPVRDLNLLSSVFSGSFDHQPSLLAQTISSTSMVKCRLRIRVKCRL